jgi:hypothetical protein
MKACAMQTLAWTSARSIQNSPRGCGMFSKPARSDKGWVAGGRSRPRIRIIGLAAAIAILAAWPAAPRWALACNTPVYRYAMYNWRSAPFFVFYFHEGEVADEDRAVNQTIAGLTENLPPQANLKIELVNVSDQKQIDRLPEFVVQAWKSHQGGQLPAHVVVSPWGAPIFAGRLNTASAASLIDSPARQRLGELLTEGHAAVMILLTCPDEDENKKAEQVLAELCKRAGAGEIPVELGLPLQVPGAAPGETGPPDAGDPNRLQIAVLKVERKDPAEEFFVRILMAVEPDLEEYAGQPMIFAGYGRGRTMEPYIGKGITPDNLVDVAAFLAGACSCLVKEQNPGVDLLVKWDWEATADELAQNDPSLNSSPYGLFGYSEIPVDAAAQTASDIGKPQPAGEAAGGTVGGSASPVASPDAPPADALAGPPGSGEQLAAAASDPGRADPAGPPVSQAPAMSDDFDRGPAGSGSYTKSRLWTYGLGMGAIAAGVVLAGWVLLLRRP